MNTTDTTLDELTDAMIDASKSALLQAGNLLEALSARKMPNNLAECLSKALTEIERAYVTLEEEFPDDEEDENEKDDGAST